jgi:hypothetical protein
MDCCTIDNGELTPLNLQSIFRSGPAEAAGSHRKRDGRGSLRDRSVTGRDARAEALAYGEGAGGSQGDAARLSVSSPLEKPEGPIPGTAASRILRMVEEPWVTTIIVMWRLVRLHHRQRVASDGIGVDDGA